MKLNLDGKIFRSVSNSDNGEVSAATTFYYHQTDNIVTADYSGGAIVKGHLIAKMSPNGQLDMRYHHINANGEVMIGTCLSTPTILPDGRIKYHERWRWLSGDQSAGESEIEEVRLN